MPAPTITNHPGGAQTVRLATWVLTDADATGTPLGPDWADYADRCFQSTGTIGTATIVLQGSNDGTNWQTLTSPAGSTITGTALSMRQVVENPLYVRPILTGAGGSTVTCTLACKRPTLGRT